MNQLDFPYPFSGFRDLDFTNCFASLYMYLEDFPRGDDYACAKKQGKPCQWQEGCHNCWQSPGNMQGRLFFLFDTVSGRAATVRGWGNKPTAILQEIYDNDDMVDFIMGYAGYGYEKHADNLMERIRASIDGGTPVLARMKKDGAPYLDDAKNNSFRVITGYDGGKLLTPEPKGAANPPKKQPKPGDIDSVYIITGKTERKYKLLDGLRRIKRVMDADRAAGTWDEYIHAFEGYWDRLKDLSLKELKQLHEYAYKGTIWNCHNFSSAFCFYKDYERAPALFTNWIWDEFAHAGLERFDGQWGAYDDSHTRQWQLHSLFETRNWRKKYYGELEWGMCETAAMILRKIKEDDDIVYGAVRELIDLLEH